MSDDHRTTTGLLSFERIGQFQSPFTPQNSSNDVGTEGGGEFTVAEVVRIQSEKSTGSVDRCLDELIPVKDGNGQ